MIDEVTGVASILLMASCLLSFYQYANPMPHTVAMN